MLLWLVLCGLCYLFIYFCKFLRYTIFFLTSFVLVLFKYREQFHNLDPDNIAEEAADTSQIANINQVRRMKAKVLAENEPFTAVCIGCASSNVVVFLIVLYFILETKVIIVPNTRTIKTL